MGSICCNNVWLEFTLGPADQNRYLCKHHQDLQCLPFFFSNCTLTPLFETVDVSKFKYGRAHSRNSGMKVLTLKAPITTAADDNLLLFFFIFQRKHVLAFHMNCWQTIHMKFQDLFFSEKKKKKKKKIECRLLKILLGALRVNNHMQLNNSPFELGLEKIYLRIYAPSDVCDQVVHLLGALLIDRDSRSL